jgi:hypothetical protein
MNDARFIGGVALAALVLVSGCAGAEGASARDAGKYLAMGPGPYASLKLDGARLSGPESDVLKTPDGYRGRLRGALVDLRAADGRITGSVGSGHTDLHYEPLADGLLLQGIFAGELSRLELGPDHLAGRIGTATFDLLRADSRTLHFETRDRQGWIDLPAVLLSYPVDDQAVWLVLLLARS